MKKRERISSRRLLLSSVMLAACGTVQAASFGTYSVNPTDTDGQVVPGFYPNVEFDVGYDDNVLREENNTQSSTFYLLKPEAQWIGAYGKHLLRFGYQGEFARYANTDAENYNDHFLGADATLDLTQKLNINAGAAYRWGHENRGLASAVFPKPNRWQEWAAKVEALYGRRTATAQIGASYEHRDRIFTNNGQFTRDFDSDQITLIGFYNLGPKTQLLVEPSYTDINYPNSDLDNDVRKILAGVTWSATAKTTGKLKVGHYNKDFADPALADASGLAVDVEVVWEPKTYSTVVLKVSRDAIDSAIGLGSSNYEASAASVDWTHDLTELTQLQVGLGYENDEYDTGREDDYLDAYIGISRAISRRVTVGARYDYGQRDSSDVGNDYDDNRITLGVKTTFD